MSYFKNHDLSESVTHSLGQLREGGKSRAAFEPLKKANLYQLFNNVIGGFSQQPTG